MTSTASIRNDAVGYRRTACLDRADKYANIDKGLIPFQFVGGDKGCSVDVRDAVILCQKAYYNFPIFRNVIDLMTEFSVNKIYFKGGTKKSRDFFEALFNKINIWDLQDRFFREYYRSGNVFIYRFDATLTQEDISRITQVYGKANTSDAAGFPKEMTVPSRFIILNPADIQLMGSLGFDSSNYYKLVTGYELARLRNPKSDEDIEVVKSLPQDVRKRLANKDTVVSIPIDMTKIASIFYKKQDYEPFAVPMGFPVLEDINFKAELKRMDAQIARTMQQAILLVTMGNEPDKGGVNQKNLEAMQRMFESPSVGRVLIADYTTKAQFVIPQIADLLDPKKYEIIERDINLGLNNIMMGGDKFANQQAQIEIFVARLNQARESFINQFLMLEIKRVSKSLGFKTFPTPVFEEFSLKDNVNKDRVVTRLIELGVLTPEEGIRAIETNRLPENESSLEAQKAFKLLKEEGLYQPLIGGGMQGPSSDAGRPQGVKAPQTTKKISPIGASEAFSLSKIKDNMLLAQKLSEAVERELKSKHKIKKLTTQQKEASEMVSEIIMANESSSAWLSSVKHYCDKPVDKNLDYVKEVQEISATHELGIYLSSILRSSVKE